MSQAEASEAFSKESLYKKNLEAVNAMMHHGTSLSGRERNCVFLNRGNGNFATISALSGYDTPDDGRGLALMDWDFDGRMDFWSSARTSPRLRFMHNQLKDTGCWFGLRLCGTGKSNRDAVGARVIVTLPSGRVLLRSVRAGEGFASQSTKWLHFGLGQESEVKSVSIRWPSGETETLGRISCNAYYTLKQGEGQLKRYQVPPRKLLVDKSNPLASKKGTGKARVPLRLPIPSPRFRYSKGDTTQIFNGRPSRPTFINLWSQSCRTCRHELAEFVRNKDRLLGRVDILALCVDPDADDYRHATGFLKELDFPWQAGVPTTGTMELLASIFNHSFPMKQHLPAPASLLVSADGKIVALYTKEIAIQQLLDDVDALACKILTASERDNVTSLFGGYWLKRPVDINLLYLPRLMMKNANVEDASNYVRKSHLQLSKHKEYAKLLVWIAEEHMKRGNKKEGIVFYNNALTAGKNKPVVLNNIAWTLATHKDADVRNGRLAVQVAYRANKLTEFKQPIYLDTLAAAYAELGDFRKALSVVEQAMKLAQQKKNKLLQDSLKKSRNRYLKNQPMR